MPKYFIPVCGGAAQHQNYLKIYTIHTSFFIRDVGIVDVG